MEEGVFHKHNYLQSLASYMQARQKDQEEKQKIIVQLIKNARI